MLLDKAFNTAINLENDGYQHDLEEVYNKVTCNFSNYKKGTCKR